MSEESISAILEAEFRTEETRGFIKQVRRVTRLKLTPEEKIHIVLEGFRHEVPIRGLYRREGIRHKQAGESLVEMGESRTLLSTDQAISNDTPYVPYLSTSSVLGFCSVVVGGNASN